MDTFIVRIYRKDDAEADNITGQIISVEREDEREFTSLDDLVEVIRDVCNCEQDITSLE